MIKSSSTQKYALSMILALISQWLITLGISFDLTWDLPLQVLLFSFLNMLVLIPLYLVNLLVLFGFAHLDSRFNTEGLFLKSLLYAVVVITGSYSLGVLIWWLIWSQNNFPLSLQDSLLGFNYFDPRSWASYYIVIFGNSLFMIVFLPIWHFKMKDWKST